MNNHTKNALLSWGGGFVTASTFGAVVPSSPVSFETQSNIQMHNGGVAHNMSALSSNVKRTMRTPSGQKILSSPAYINPKAKIIAEHMRNLQARLTKTLGNK